MSEKVSWDQKTGHIKLEDGDRHLTLVCRFEGKNISTGRSIYCNSNKVKIVNEDLIPELLPFLLHNVEPNLNNRKELDYISNMERIRAEQGRYIQKLENSVVSHEAYTKRQSIVISNLEKEVRRLRGEIEIRDNEINDLKFKSALISKVKQNNYQISNHYKEESEEREDTLISGRKRTLESKFDIHEVLNEAIDLKKQGKEEDEMNLINKLIRWHEHHPPVKIDFWQQFKTK